MKYNYMKYITTILLLILLLTGCVGNKSQPSKGDMSLAGKKILMVIAPMNFRDAEYNEPRSVLENSGAEIKVASIQKGTSIGAEGTKVEIDLTVSEVNVGDYDVVAFIGGPGMAEIIDDDSLQILAKKFYDAGKLTTAICVAPAILAKAGILSGKQATAWSGSENDLTAGGASYTGEPVTIDGKIVTADGPTSARAFGEKIAELLR